MPSKKIKLKNSIALFEQKEIRKVWDNEKGRWFFSVVDVVEALTESTNPKDYLKKLRKRDEGLDAKWGTICTLLDNVGKDGKKRKISMADTEGILRIIQSIPSKKAEPFKRWLARVGRERIDEINDPELAAKRMRDIYRAKGYSDAWIEQRELGIVARHRLTEEWSNRGVNSGREYAILTNEIYRGGFGLGAKEYKEYKNLSREQNLRDSMTPMELALTNLGETTATELHRKNESYGVKELKNDTKNAGEVVKTAREAAEERLGAPVVSKQNYLDLTEPDALEAPDGQGLLGE